eukprot:12187010-Alexandrium_andersonii.AAC.1
MCIRDRRITAQQAVCSSLQKFPARPLRGGGSPPGEDEQETHRNRSKLLETAANCLLRCCTLAVTRYAPVEGGREEGDEVARAAPAGEQAAADREG